MSFANYLYTVAMCENESELTSVMYQCEDHDDDHERDVVVGRIKSKPNINIILGG